MAKVNASPKKKVQAKSNTTGQLMAPPADPSVNAPRKFSGFTGKMERPFIKRGKRDNEIQMIQVIFVQTVITLQERMSFAERRHQNKTFIKCSYNNRQVETLRIPVL